MSTEDGVPYTVRILAENSAGNGTMCNVTDFTDELGKSYCSTSVFSRLPSAPINSSSKLIAV